ncbi:MAG: hypothetical protein ACUVWO_08785 [Thermodesulfobacteriota bacterium]
MPFFRNCVQSDEKEFAVLKGFFMERPPQVLFKDLKEEYERLFFRYGKREDLIDGIVLQAIDARSPLRPPSESRRDGCCQIKESQGKKVQLYGKNLAIF